MTIAALIKKLKALENEFGSRIRVCADTQDLRDSCNDVWQIVDIGEVKHSIVEVVDGDGSKEFYKNGMEKLRPYIVLKA